ncbi:MAG: redoxin domain-containing protein [Alphaproteobacteria bacterium]|nr:redoxin domain-containing protein [Alphaproteobacteria bacterium]MCB9797735.1 redoxin domain-containing protein [Alphaproteobacteria bacterium]
MRIVAVGFADPEVTAAWRASLDYEYEVWTDAEQVLAEHYGVLSAWDDAPLRHAWILDDAGQAVVFHEGAVSLGADPGAVLEDCRSLFGG